MTPFEVVDRWFALHLTVGVLSALLIRSLIGIDQREALFAGSGVALLVAILWVRVAPQFHTGPAWRVGLVALAIAIVVVFGAWLVGVGYRPTERLLYPVAVGVALVVEWLRRRWRAGDAVAA